MSASAAQRRFALDEPEPEEPGLLMTSMIDIIFILLAAFLCVTELKKGKLSVDVPEVPAAESSPAQAEEADPLVIEVTGEDAIVVDGVPAADYEELTRLLEERARDRGTNGAVHLAGDKAASNGAMMQVVSRLSRAGFKRIEYAVEAGN